MTKAEKPKDMNDSKKPSLALPGKLPFEDYASDINVGDLARILVHRNVLSVDDYELLVMRGHMFPRLEAMNDSNWQEIKAQLLSFLDKKNWRRSDEAEQKEDGDSGTTK